MIGRAMILIRDRDAPCSAFGLSAAGHPAATDPWTHFPEGEL
jgi:hypothetical protein